MEDFFYVSDKWLFVVSAVVAIVGTIYLIAYAISHWLDRR